MCTGHSLGSGLWDSLPLPGPQFPHPQVIQKVRSSISAILKCQKDLAVCLARRFRQEFLFSPPLYPRWEVRDPAQP